MINNINYTIKIDLNEFCEQLLELDANMFGVTLEKLKNDLYFIPEWNVKGNKIEIMHWFYLKNLEWEKQQEDELIENLKNDNLEYVIERMGK